MKTRTQEEIVNHGQAVLRKLVKELTRRYPLLVVEDRGDFSVNVKERGDVFATYGDEDVVPQYVWVKSETDLTDLVEEQFGDAEVNLLLNDDVQEIGTARLQDSVDEMVKELVALVDVGISVWRESHIKRLTPVEYDVYQTLRLPK